jgi:hypothetical protein
MGTGRRDPGRLPRCGAERHGAKEAGAEAFMFPDARGRRGHFAFPANWRCAQVPLPIGKFRIVPHK